MNKSTQQKLFYTALIYISICVLFVVGFYVFGLLVKTYNIQTDFPYGEDPYLLTMIYVVFGGIGISGMVGFFLVPFFPLIVLNSGIYIVVRYLYKKDKLYIARKTAKLFVLFAVVSLAAMYSHTSIDFYLDKREASGQNDYYWEKYGTEEKVVLTHRMIFSSYNNKVYLVSTAGEETVLFDYSGNPDVYKVNYVSPYLSYYIDYNIIRKMKNNDILLDINIIKEKNIIVDCLWSSNESFLACQYRYKSDQLDENRHRERERLYLYNIQKNAYQEIYDKRVSKDFLGYDYYDNEPYESFSFDETSNTLYYDYDNSIYKVDNLQEMSQSNFTIEPRIAKLENMHPCRMITYDNNTIYCYVRAEEIKKTIQDQDNPLVEGREFFIIKQNLNQKSPEDYQVLNLAPLRDANQLTVLSDTHIDFGGTIINMKTGRIVKDAPDFGLGGSPGTRSIRYWGE